MKPLTTAAASFWATLVLIALFSLGDYIFPGIKIGTLALLICLIFLHNTYAGKVARIYFVALLILIVVIVIVGVIIMLNSGMGFNELFEYEFPFLQDKELEAFANLFRLA